MENDGGEVLVENDGGEVLVENDGGEVLKKRALHHESVASP